MIKVIIFGMAIVTYLPRLLPLYFLADRDLHPKLEIFLSYIPYTSLSILITRGIVNASSDLLLPYGIGLGLAALVSYFKPNLVLAVLTSIVTAFLMIHLL